MKGLDRFGVGLLSLIALHVYLPSVAIIETLRSYISSISHRHGAHGVRTGPAQCCLVTGQSLPKAHQASEQCMEVSFSKGPSQQTLKRFQTWWDMYGRGKVSRPQSKDKLNGSFALSRAALHPGRAT